jgi:hypothetical protein
MADSRIRVLGTLLAQYILPTIAALGWEYPLATTLLLVIVWDTGRKAAGAWPTVLALAVLIALLATLY